jgi:hypothetical protein
MRKFAHFAPVAAVRFDLVRLRPPAWSTREMSTRYLAMKSTSLCLLAGVVGWMPPFLLPFEEVQCASNDLRLAAAWLDAGGMRQPVAWLAWDGDVCQWVCDDEHREVPEPPPFQVTAMPLMTTTFTPADLRLVVT